MAQQTPEREVPCAARAHPHLPATVPDAVRRPAQRVWGEVTAWAASTTRLDVVVLFTLLLLIEGGPGRPVGTTHLLCFAGIVYRPLTRRAAFWFLLGGLYVAFFLPQNWTLADNHKWLIIYWCFAMGLAMRSAAPLATLATSARLMIGLLFFFATAWKIASPYFPNGDFFHFTLITDPRFAEPAEIVGGLPEGASASNHALIDAWDDPAAPLGSAALTDGPRIAALAQLMAVGTIALEGLVALAFLVPERWRLSRVREALLLAFLVATYPIAPVIAFGWLLTAMGLAQSRLRRPVGEVLYVLAFLAVFSFTGMDLVWSLVRRVLLGG